jgi:hypothetical protein
LPFGETLVWAFWTFVGIGTVGKSVSLVVDGEIIDCAGSWPNRDSERAVVWILLVAPEEPALYVNERVASGTRPLCQ